MWIVNNREQTQRSTKGWNSNRQTDPEIEEEMFPVQTELTLKESMATVIVTYPITVVMCTVIRHLSD